MQKRTEAGGGGTQEEGSEGTESGMPWGQEDAPEFGSVEQTWVAPRR